MSPEKCPECQIWHDQGASYCGGCGRNLSGFDVQEEDGDTVFFRTFSFVSTACTLAILLLALFFIFVNIDQVYAGLTASGSMLFSVGLVAVIASLALTVYSARRACGKPGIAKDNVANSSLVGIGIGLSVTLALSYLYIFTTMALGQNIGTGIFDRYTEYQLAALLMLAGPEEEFLYRLLPIGIPMVILGYIARKKNSWKYALGGCGMSRIAWLLVIASAVIFGFAHLDSWNLVKVPQAAISGIIFGYLYCEYGIHVSLLVHSTLDCMTVAGYVIGSSSVVLFTLMLLMCGAVLIIITLSRIRKNGIKDNGWFGEEIPDGILSIWHRH